MDNTKRRNDREFMLGDWLIEPSRNRLSQDGQSTTIENKTMDVLVCLASQPGQVFSNDDLIESVWDNRPMGENPVYKCIANLRSALGDDPRSPAFVETIPRKGYRLVAEVEIGDAGARQATVNDGRKKTLAALAAVVLVTATLLVVMTLQRTETTVESLPDMTANSIAVLPFENLTETLDNDFLGAGIADELLNRLAEMSALRVVARHSSFSRRDQTTDLRQFAKRLGVQYLLSGTIRQGDETIRVTARLVDLEGTLKWSDSYDRSPSGFVSLQDDIADAVARDLTLNAGDMFADKVVATKSFEAYSSYLHGKELVRRRTTGYGPLAIEAFENAIRIDPEFAAPYAGLAAAHLLSNRNSAASMEIAEASIEAALRLDQNLAEAHEAAGLASMWKGSTADYRRAEVSLRRALQLNPSLVDAHNWLSITLLVLQQPEEAFQVLNSAIELDPLNSLLIANLGRRYQSDGRLDAARQAMVRATSYPDSPAYIRTWLADIEIDSGRFDSALERMKQAETEGAFVDEANNWHAGTIGTHYAQLGMFDLANLWMSTLEMPDASHWRLAVAFGVYSVQQDLDELRAAVERYEATVSLENPLTLMSRSLIGRLAVLERDDERAIEVLAPVFTEGWAMQNGPGGSDQLFTTAHFYALALRRSGKPVEAQVIMEDVLKRQLTRREGRTRLLGQILAREAVTYLLLGEREIALRRLEQAVAANWRHYYKVKNNPWWDELRGDPVFDALLAKIKADIDIQRERVVAAERLQPFLPSET